MKNLIALSVTLLLMACFTAQSFVTMSGGSQMDRGVFVSQLSDGGYVAVGVSSSFGAGDEDVYLVRTDQDGKEVWTQTLGGSGSDNGWSVLETGGGLILAGFTDSFGQGDYDCLLVKTDANGNELWNVTYGGEASDRCWALLETGDGGFVLLGETESFGQGMEDCYLVRTDGSGDELWFQTYGGSEGDRCFAMAQTLDGGYMLAGQTYSEGAGDRDVFVIRVDAAGNEVWTRTFGGPDSDVGHGISRNDAGDFLITGYTTSLAIDGDDPFLIRMDDTGDVLWTRVLSMGGINHTITGEEATDGGFYLGGFNELTSPRQRSALLVKTLSDGTLDWTREFFATTTGQSMGYTVRATRDGGSVLTGHTTEQSIGDLDIFILKTDDAGN